MKPNQEITVKLFTSGYCTASRKHVFPQDKAEKIRFYATWALIQHPDLGNILFDTGYSHAFFEATRNYPNRIYRFITPVFHDEGESAVDKLQANGIHPEDIDHIVISHFHADHTAGLKDFPGIPIWCSRPALEFVNSRNRYNAVLSGILKPLHPEDLNQRSNFPEEQLSGSSLARFKGWSWTDDIMFVDLPGHARGQLGLFIRNSNMGDILLVGDATWSQRSIREKIYPSRIVRLFIDSFRELRQTMDKLHEFQTKNKDVKIIPTHCSEILTLAE